MKVSLHSDACDRDAHREQCVDLLHVIGQAIAGKDVVVVQKQPGVRVAVSDPLRHLPGDLGTKPLLVIVGMDHFVIQVVLTETVAVAGGDGPATLLERQPQARIGKLLHPVLDAVRNSPVNAVAAYRNAHLAGPG